MAPEVGLGQPYTEKVDVYSFSLIVWEMATDELPYVSYSMMDFTNNVFMGGVRPRINPFWPIGFQSLLRDSWQVDQFSRPSFETIIQRLDALIQAEPVLPPEDNDNLLLLYIMLPCIFAVSYAMVALDQLINRMVVVIVCL